MFQWEQWNWNSVRVCIVRCCGWRGESSFLGSSEWTGAPGTPPWRELHVRWKQRRRPEASVRPEHTNTHVEFKHWQENFFSSLCPPLRVVQAPHWRRAGRRRKSRSRFHRSTPWGRSYRGSSAAAAETSRCAELLNIFVVFDNQIFNDRQEQFQAWGFKDQRVFSFKQQHSGLL